MTPEIRKKLEELAEKHVELETYVPDVLLTPHQLSRHLKERMSDFIVGAEEGYRLAKETAFNVSMDEAYKMCNDINYIKQILDRLEQIEPTTT